MSGRRAGYTYRHALTWAAAAALAFGLAERARAAIDLKLTDTGDTELREDDPTNARGTTGPTELAVRFTGGTNRHSMVRFDLTGLTVGDVTNADLRLIVQRNSTFPTAAGGLRIYGLQPTALLQNWNEASVYYRSRGTHTSQPNATTPFSGPPTAEDPVYGASASDPNRAPGLTFQAPPFNNTAWNGGVSPTNQPNYNGTSGGDAGTVYPIVTEDFDPAQTVLLGFMNYDAVSPARPGGSVLSFDMAGFQTGQGFSGAPNNAANNSSLVSWLQSIISSGGTSATLMIAGKIAGDPGNVNSSNHIFGSKEEAPGPAGGPANTGDYAPQLIINPVTLPAPEPTSAALCAAAASAGLMIRRRRQN